VLWTSFVFKRSHLLLPLPLFHFYLSGLIIVSLSTDYNLVTINLIYELLIQFAVWFLLANFENEKLLIYTKFQSQLFFI
jgi:hypothetical protein